VTTVESSPIAHRSAWGVDWRRLASRALIASLVAAAVITLARNALGSQYGYDFYGGMWKAGQDLLAGRSPYLAPNAHQLLVAGNSLITPPLLAVVAIPFSVLPFGLGVALWNLVCAAAFAGALVLLGVRDRRVVVIALCSFPFVSSLILGQPDGLFALAAAAAWRWRDSWRGAIAVGVLIAAKLLAWPLLLWLLVTRRVKCSAIALCTAVALLLLSWAPIGFKGLVDYPQLLAADARAFATRSHSVVAGAMRLGVSEQLATVLAIAVAAAVAVAIIRAARGSDRGYFAAAIAAGLLASPLLWSHYLVLLFVPLAIGRPRKDQLWLLSAAFWLSPIEPAHGWQIGLVLLTATTIAIGASASSRLGTRPANDSRVTPA
jgi:alpha-1,2-mannosyltransferase